MARAQRQRPTLVTGAAGKTGRAVISALVSRGVAVHALVRSAKQHQAVARLGAARVLEGDLRSRETVIEAVAGVGAIYHICPNMHPDEVGIGRRLISAALGAGVGHIAYHSVLHPQIEAMPHHWAKLRVEELLFESRIGYTILQPAPYMQNVLGQWRSVTGQGTYRVPYALDTRVAMVDLEDVAEVAARVLTESGHAGATYELCGPDLPDQREIAEALGRGLGRTVRAETATVIEARPTRTLLGSSNHRDNSELHWRLAKPVSVLVLAVFALVLAHTDARRGRIANLVAAILVYFTYTNLLGVGETLLKSERVPPPIGLWWVHLSMGTIAAYLLVRRAQNRPLLPRRGGGAA